MMKWRLTKEKKIGILIAMGIFGIGAVRGLYGNHVLNKNPKYYVYRLKEISIRRYGWEVYVTSQIGNKLFEGSNRVDDTAGLVIGKYYWMRINPDQPEVSWQLAGRKPLTDSAVARLPRGDWQLP